MPIGIGSNIASLAAQRRLADATSTLTGTYERLASGQRINKASDDAAGLAISSGLNSRAQVFGQAVRNANDGISLYSIADATVSSLTDINMRLQELASQAANGVYSTTQRQAIDAEAQALSKEYFRISRAAQFNGIRLFDGTMSSGLTLQLGYGTSGSIQAAVGGKLGDGTVSVASTIASDSSNTRDVALGDLNGDGVLDMVTVGNNASEQGTVAIRIGNGSGGFSTSAVFTDSTLWNSVALGDLNGDGALDLAVAGSGGGGRASVFLNNGNGTYRLSASYSQEGTSSAAITLGDLNGDGVLDLVTAGSTSGTGRATVRLGAGDGTFRSSVSFITENSSSNAVRLADLNKDSRLDLITAGNGGAAGVFTVRLGTGTGSFGSATSYTADANDTLALAVGDINNDGNLDVVTAGIATILSTGSTTVRLGDGSGGFGTATASTTASLYGFKDVELADLSGDGNLDVLVGSVATFSASQVIIRQGSGSGTFGAATSVSLSSDGLGGSPNRITTGDVNGDGVTDVIHVGRDYSYTGVSTVLFGNTRDGISPLQPFSLLSRGDALQALGLFSRTARNLSDITSSLGATQSRLDIAINGLASTRENYIAADSRIRDADVAQEATRLVSTQIRQRAAAGVLAQANQVPALALRLLT